MNRIDFFAERLMEQGIWFETQIYDDINVIFIPEKSNCFVAVADFCSDAIYIPDLFSDDYEGDGTEDECFLWGIAVNPSKRMIKKFEMCPCETVKYNPLEEDFVERQSGDVYQTDAGIDWCQLLEMLEILSKKKYTSYQLEAISYWLDFDFGRNYECWWY